MKNRPNACLPFAVAAFAAACPTVRAQWTITSLHPDTATESVARSVNGTQIGGEAIFSGVVRPVLWNDAGASFDDLSPPTPITYGAIRGISESQQVGSVRFGGGGAPFFASLWSGAANSWIDLHPSGYAESFAQAAFGSQQVGSVQTLADRSHAALWQGSAASFVDLNPPEALQSSANGTSGTQQVGSVGIIGSPTSASIWNGTATSWINLHPPTTNGSIALSTTGTQQAGYASVGPQQVLHASLWRGTAASWVDLHPAGAIESFANSNSGPYQAGWVLVPNGPPGAPPVYRACIWTGTAASIQILPIDLPGIWGSTFAHGVWTDGQTISVVGMATDLTGAPAGRAWLWRRTVPPPCIGDLNFDRLRNTGDLVVFLAQFGGSGTGLSADLNNDNAVNTVDLVIFLGVFGIPCP
ncbi:MAG: hypothetical protein ACKVZJ_04075 [Phycisphaerales bacterium]